VLAAGGAFMSAFAEAAVSGEIAAMRRDLGRQLAALRRQAGLSQFGLAEMIGFSRSAVSLAEIGRQGQDRKFWMACDKALDTGGVLADGVGQVDAVRHAQERSAALAAQEAREARAVAAMAEAGQPRLLASVTAVQACPQCGAEVTVLATLIPGNVKGPPSGMPVNPGGRAGNAEP
jgi:transcriptional regulator with XRE-family HTH domain